MYISVFFVCKNALLWLKCNRSWAPISNGWKFTIIPNDSAFVQHHRKFVTSPKVNHPMELYGRFCSTMIILRENRGKRHNL